MGVDTIITLPADVRVGDAAVVLGILAGCPKHWHEDNRETKWVVVEDVVVKPIDIPECARIELPGHSILWHFEGPRGARLLMPRSTPYWIAMGRALVDFFGGTVDYQDCDDVVDYQRPKPRLRNDPEDDGEWDAFQQALFALQPLSQADIDAVRQYAAYK